MSTTCATTRTVVNERSTFVLRVAFFDEDDQPAVPDAVTYRIDDPIVGTAILAPTAVSLGSPAGTTVDLQITSDDNASLDGRQYQRRLVTLEWDWEAGHGTSEYEYFVKNLYGVSSGSI